MTLGNAKINNRGASRTTFYRGEALEPTNPRSLSSWQTAEYQSQRGLELIRAAAGYAVRTTGRPGGGGRTIAFVGRRIPADIDYQSSGHPDLHGVTLAPITTVATPVTSQESHETFVAGIAAARRNGYGMHGVAYNANIISVPVFKDRRGNASGWDMEANLASIAGLKRRFSTSFSPDFDVGNRSFESNPAASAHVANLSIHTIINFTRSVKRGMKLMAQRGRIMVAALGNEGKPNAPWSPAKDVTAPGIAGSAIAVGSLNSRGTAAASHSNRCGAVKRYCIFAPGSNVYSTTGQYPGWSIRQSSSIFTPRLFGTDSGTSYATPHVSGAVAAVWAAFPNKTGKQIVQRILDTARQVDTANGNYDSDGLSAIYGHGALDLGAAMNPAGFTSLSTSVSGMIPVRRSFIFLPPGFRHRPTAVLRDAVVYDRQMFPFLHDLNGAIRTHRAHSAADALDDFLSPPGYVWSSEPLGRRARVEFARSERDRTTQGPRKDVRTAGIRDYRLHVAAGPALSFRLGRSLGPDGTSGNFVARRLGRGLFRDGFVVEPLTEFAGDGTALGMNWRPDGRTWLDFAGGTGSGYFGGGRTRLASIGVTRRFGDGLMMRVRYGALHERGSLLGIRGSGAFRDTSGARTDFLGFGMENRLASGAALFGSVGYGVTEGDPTGSGPLVSGWMGGGARRSRWAANGRTCGAVRTA